LAIQFEERDLARERGEAYEAYRRSAPMLVPFIGNRGSGLGAEILKEEPNGGYLKKRDEAVAKKSNV